METGILRGRHTIPRPHFCPQILTKKGLAQPRTIPIHLRLEPVNLRYHSSIANSHIIDHSRPQAACPHSLTWSDAEREILNWQYQLNRRIHGSQCIIHVGASIDTIPDKAHSMTRVGSNSQLLSQQALIGGPTLRLRSEIS